MENEGAAGFEGEMRVERTWGVSTTKDGEGATKFISHNGNARKNSQQYHFEHASNKLQHD